MREMGFNVRGEGYEVENPRQFVALTDALDEELRWEPVKSRRAKKGAAIRALSTHYRDGSES